MIVQKIMLEKLKDFGLNSYEVKIWTALLSRGVSTAGELSDIANVPRSRSYDVLQSLEKKGFVIMKLGKPIKYIAVPPTEVIERIKKNIYDKAKFKEKLLEEIEKSNVINDLSLLYSEGIELIEPTDFTGAIKGRNNLYNHLEFMINSANTSIIIMSTEKGLVRKIKSLKKTLEKAHKRGVNIKIAAPLTLSNKETADELENIAEIRNSAVFKSRFLIIDKKEISFMLLDDEKVHSSYDVGVWINAPFFTDFLVNMFELAWKTMK